MNIKKSISFSLISLMVLSLIISLFFINQPLTASANFDYNVNHKASVLIERKSGKILLENNSHEKMPIASVTKLMTILLTLEKVESGEILLDDNVLVSENANGMGGSQIFLDANTEYKLHDLLKSVVVASANDSSVALAEYIAGSENNFVKMMNDRARELNMNDTHYSNCTGLPTADGLSSAYDQAILLNKVLDYSTYHDYSSIWHEDFAHPSGRTTQMTNTNKLSRYYEGCIGGKTGSTNQAKYCLAVGAKRGDMELISVVLGTENSKERFKLASDLLNYGFNSFESKTLFNDLDLQGKSIAIKGMDRSTKLKAQKDFTIVFDKNEKINYSLNFNLPNELASVTENQIVGNVEIVVDGIVVETINILSSETHNEATVWDYFKEIINN